MPTNASQPNYKRILLKLSGEALQGDGEFGIAPAVLDSMATQIGQLARANVQVGIVIGGGNLFRGSELSAAGLDRVTGDHMGMLATVMNSLAMKDALDRAGVKATVMSSIAIDSVAQGFDYRVAKELLTAGEVVILAGGTGNPFFTTDTAACLRGIEISADVVMKATKVDGVYDKDPVKHADAVKFDRLSYDDVLERKLGVMDLTAICLVRDHNMPLRVFNMNKAGGLVSVVMDAQEGTLVNGDQ